MKSFKKHPPQYFDYAMEYQAGFVRWFNENKGWFAVPVEMSGITNPPPECARRDIRLSFPTLPRCLQIRMIIGPYRQFMVDAGVEWNGKQIYLENFSELFVEDFHAWGYTYTVKSLEPICEPLLKWVNEELATATAVRLRQGVRQGDRWTASLIHGVVATQPTDLYDIPLTGDCIKYMLAKRQYPIGHELIVAVQGAKHIVVFTGAGVLAFITQLAQHCQLTLLTQNANDLLERAPSTNVLRVHELMTEQEFQHVVATAKACDVLLIVGASGLGPRLLQIPVVAAKAGAFVAEVAMQKADSLPITHQRVYGPAATMLPLLVQAAFPEHK